MRKAELERNTKETQIKLSLALDGKGESNLKEGEFQSVPDAHNSYDVMWINKSN